MSTIAVDATALTERGGSPALPSRPESPSRRVEDEYNLDGALELAAAASGAAPSAVGR